MQRNKDNCVLPSIVRDRGFVRRDNLGKGCYCANTLLLNKEKKEVCMDMCARLHVCRYIRTYVRMYYNTRLYSLVDISL